MPRPRPTPPPLVPPDDPGEFAVPEDYALKAGGPREFAKRTRGSRQEGGASQLNAPEPSN